MDDPPRTKEMKKKKLRYECWKLGCTERFVSWQQRKAHVAEAHKEPIKSRKEMLRYGESHLLRGGQHLSVGDRIKFLKEGIVTAIITTQGENDVRIEVAVITDVYE